MKKQWKRLLSVMIAIALVVGMFPAQLVQAAPKNTAVVSTQKALKNRKKTSKIYQFCQMNMKIIWSLNLQGLGHILKFKTVATIFALIVLFHIFVEEAALGGYFQY